MKRVGPIPGEAFDLGKSDPALRAALEQVPADGLQLMRDQLPTLRRIVNGSSMNTERLYALRGEVLNGLWVPPVKHLAD